MQVVIYAYLSYFYFLEVVSVSAQLVVVLILRGFLKKIVLVVVCSCHK